jgi:hypothetical protein
MDPIDVGTAWAIVILSGGGMIVLGMFARALLKKWSLPKQGVPQEDLERLRRVVEDLALDVGELHERMDFAERVLSSHPESKRLNEGA